MFVFFLASRTLILCWCFSPFGRLEDQPEINDDIFLCPFICLRWLRVLEGGSCVACRASHFIKLPCQHLFVLFLFFVSLLSAAQHLTPAVVLILVFTMCIRVLLLYAYEITHTFFLLLGLDNVYFCLLMVAR